MQQVAAIALLNQYPLDVFLKETWLLLASLLSQSFQLDGTPKSNTILDTPAAIPTPPPSTSTHPTTVSQFQEITPSNTVVPEMSSPNTHVPMQTATHAPPPPKLSLELANLQHTIHHKEFAELDLPSS